MPRPFLWILILSLLLPSFGSMAAGMAVAEPCPMLSMSGHSAEMTQDPCCEDMDHKSDFSKSPCKPGLECKTGGMSQMLVLKSFTPVHPLSVVLATPSTLQRQPPNLWRPPRYL